MKKIYIIIALAMALTGFSCSKSFLDRTPIDQKVESDFYKTPDDAFEALVSAYSVLDISGNGNIMLSAELASDDCFGGGGTADDGVIQWDKFKSYNDHNADAWTKYYQGIYRTNQFLKKVDGVDFSADPDLKQQYIGEAKFLRAYFYFDLVRMFGHVPLITAPIEGDNYSIPQADPDSVYALISSDLQEAITDLSATAVPYNQIAASDYGRATKWAAESLMGRVFLYYTGYYSKSALPDGYTKDQATKAIDDVITNSGYGLVEHYKDLWHAASLSDFAGQNNKEAVFAIQYTSAGHGDWNLQNGNRFQVMVGIRNQVLDPYYKGWGFGPVNPKLWNDYKDGDTRKTASIISIDGEGYTGTYAVGDQAQYTGYFWKKYTPVGGADRPDANGGDFQIDNYDNYVVIRFADILLMGAELNLNNNLSKAQGYINQVRDRAFEDASHRVTLVSGAQGIKTIMEERRLELALEGQRYWDLLRQGLDVAKAAIDNSSTDPDFQITFPTDTKGLFEIPQTQIGLSNGTLIQNAGY
ncbi:Starch-binding associating with outer membrane [Arachidicoccus rhizosphaerae]|uniref:Starch-binding associating with outer membrane n=1 Tax=Arachidicoccus rhizosphaerae TaxID=551991 RepID=A0A1H3VFC3_9BACT|nr:RagB/SusD family nutrient uptake outer membrane protein [Arachidicoccus rhizosphaerae]SDZ73456.1 Starch-binding associating with outer membrane [Arachidicoccus rhizosphaerae]